MSLASYKLKFKPLTGIFELEQEKITLNDAQNITQGSVLLTNGTQIQFTGKLKIDSEGNIIIVGEVL